VPPAGPFFLGPQMKHTLIFSAGIAALLLAGVASVQAAESTPSLPQALPASELAATSGGASPVNLALSKQTLTALNTGNQVNGESIVTGNVNVDPSAFNGFNGIGNFVFNTGNNNNLQGSLSVTILTPAN
jgi:hypothetical protein